MRAAVATTAAGGPRHPRCPSISALGSAARSRYGAELYWGAARSEMGGSSISSGDGTVDLACAPLAWATLICTGRVEASRPWVTAGAVGATSGDPLAAAAGVANVDAAPAGAATPTRQAIPASHTAPSNNRDAKAARPGWRGDRTPGMVNQEPDSQGATPARGPSKRSAIP